MGRKEGACGECTQKCLLVHGNKKKRSPDAATFFKIMFGDQFSEVLFLPPKFAPTVSAFVDQEAVLEDSRGMQWKVTISMVDGSLAFQQGWNAFSLDHDLKVGEFLIFNYIMCAHFAVKIYDKSACEKLKFPEPRKPKKRTRDDGKSTFEDVSCHTIHSRSRNTIGPSSFFASDSDEEISQCLYKSNGKGKGKGKAPIVTESASNRNRRTAVIVKEKASKFDNSNERPKLNPKEEYIEEMMCMIDRNLGNKQEDDRACFFDLSNFEMWKKDSSPGGSNAVVANFEAWSPHDDSSTRLRNEPSAFDEDPASMAIPINEILPNRKESSIGLRNEAGLVDKNPVAEEAVSAAIPINEILPNCEESSIGLRNEAGSVDKIPVAAEAVSTAIPIHEICSHLVDFPLDLGNAAGLIDRTPVAKEAMTTECPSGASNSNRTEKNSSPIAKAEKPSPSDVDSSTNKIFGHLFPIAAINLDEITVNTSNISNRPIKKCLTVGGSESLSGKKVAVSGKEHDLFVDDNCQESYKEFTGISQSFDKKMKFTKVEAENLASHPRSPKSIPETNGESSKVFNMACSQVSIMNLREHVKVLAEVKSEPVDAVKTFPSSSSSFSCSVGSQSYLEFQNMPLSLRPIIRGRRGTASPDRKVVFLRDPLMRLWPVLYVEKSFSRALASGWEAFSKANIIQPGDKCVIRVEDEAGAIFVIDIVRKVR